MLDSGLVRPTTPIRIAQFAAIVVAALAVSAIVAGLGPEDSVVCGRGHALNRLAQAVMQPLGAGHIDGPTTTKCVVPSTMAWLLASGVFVLIVGTALVRAWVHRTSIAPYGVTSRLD
jgi:hypothetical protein